VPALEKLLESHMTGALQLDVPLVIDTGVGPNWREAH
jgi:DNA polymerase I-like protein with 3'-5' exonuclease and polymerase domains